MEQKSVLLLKKDPIKKEQPFSKTEAASSKNTTTEEKAAIGMFAEVVLGKRLQNSEGKNVFKFVLISRPAQDGLIEDGAQVINVALRQEGIRLNADNKMVSFDSEGKLLWHFRYSQDLIDGESLKVFGGLYNAIERVVRDKPTDQSKNKAMTEFNELQFSLRSRLETLEKKARFILSVSEHTGMSAWGPEYGGAFFQEMLLKDGKMYAPDPDPKKGIVEFNANIASGGAGSAHGRSITYLIEKAKEALNAGANSIVAYQVDATMSVKPCGGSDRAVRFYEESMVIKQSQAIETSIMQQNQFGNYTNFSVPQSSQPNGYSWTPLREMHQSNNQYTENAPKSSGGSTEGTASKAPKLETYTCTECEKVNSVGIVCPCKVKRKRAASVSPLRRR